MIYASDYAAYFICVLCRYIRSIAAFGKGAVCIACYAAYPCSIAAITKHHRIVAILKRIAESGISAEIYICYIAFKHIAGCLKLRAFVAAIYELYVFSFSDKSAYIALRFYCSRRYAARQA